MKKLIVILIAVLFILFVVDGLTSYAQEKTGEFSGKIFTKAPENPKTPEQVVVAFYFLVKEERYAEAEKLVSQDFLEEFRHGKLKMRDFMQRIQSLETKDKDMLSCSYWYISVHFIESGLNGSYNVDEKTLDKIRKGEPVKLGNQKSQRVKLLSINEEHIKGTEIYVYLAFHLKTDQKSEFEKSPGYKEHAFPIKLVKQNGEWKMTWIMGRSFVKAPENPKTPEQVVAAFFFLLKKQKYPEAMELMVNNPFEEYGFDESMIVLDDADEPLQGLQKIRVNRRDVLKKSYWEVILYSVERGSKGTYWIDEETFNTVKKGKGKPVKIEYNGETEIVKLVSVNEEHLAGTEAEVFITFFFCTTNSWKRSQRTELVNIDGKWKIVE